MDKEEKIKELELKLQKGQSMTSKEIEELWQYRLKMHQKGDK